VEAIGKLLENLGFAAPLLYAGATYGLFYWLDENLSDVAKAALASTMKLKNYRKEQIASALVEVFDRIYTRPLLRWRAFVRSLLFTTVVSVIFMLEILGPTQAFFLLPKYMLFFSFNIFTDYLSLFVIRSFLIRSGTKAVIGLTLAAASGAAIVLLANTLRLTTVALGLIWYRGLLQQVHASAIRIVTICFMGTFSESGLVLLWPAIVVFAWLPLFALGILAIRALTPLSWLVGKAQWALKEGDKHPLKAIGCVAAVAVFAVTVGLRAIFAA
jgi:hypothetical protein